MKASFKTKGMSLVLLFALALPAAACGGADKAPEATPASAPTATPVPTAAATPAPVEAVIDHSGAGIGMMIQEYFDNGFAEIPMITYDGQQQALAEFNYKDPEIEALNNAIKGGPLKLYQDYTEGKLDGDALEIRSYPFMMDDEFIQIVTTCVVYPETIPEETTRLWSYNFSKAENRAYDVDEMLAQYGLTQEALRGKFDALYESDVEGISVYSLEATGFLINRIPAAPVTHFLLEVMLETESDPWKSFFLYTPEHEELLELDHTLLFDPAEWDMVPMDPPLSYESEGEGTLLAHLTLDAEGLEEITPDEEYCLDGALYYTLQTLAGSEHASSEEVLACILELEGDEAANASISESEEYSALFTYPTWLITYDSGGEHCIDLYIQTDTFDFRVHTRMPVDEAALYQDEISARFASVDIVF